MKKVVVLLMAIVCLCACTSVDPKEHIHAIGFHPLENSLLMDSSFSLCDTSKIYYYYNKNSADDRKAYFKGGPKAIKRTIRQAYPKLDLQEASGMLTIHFVLNCKGEIDRFEFVENDLNYQPKTFSSVVRNKLFAVHKSLKGWTPIYINGANRDCYMHTTYKLENGQITEILP